MLRTRAFSWVIALALLGGFAYVAHELDGSDGMNGFGIPFTDQQNTRPHKINNMKDHDGGVIRILIIWKGIKPQSAYAGFGDDPERLTGEQIPKSPSRIQRTYTYNAGRKYVAGASQGQATFEGPLDCEITIDGIHADGDHLAHGGGGVDCWVIAA